MGTLAHQCFAALACIAFAHATLSDEVVMKNGDRLTGEVITTKDGQLVLRTSYAGDIHIALSEIRRISTDTPVTLVLEDGSKMTSRLSAVDDTEPTFERPIDPSLRAIPIGQIAAINPPEVPKVKVTGQINAGLKRERGNTDEEDYQVDAEVVFRWIDRRLRIRADGALEYTDDDKTRQEGQLGLKHDHFFDNGEFLFHRRWYLWSGALFEHDKFADLDLRTSVGIGPGYQVIETERTQLSVEGGAAYVWENFDEDDDNDYASAVWALDFKHQVFADWKLQAFHNHDIRWSVEDGDEYVFRSQTGLRVPVFDGLQATLQFNFDRNNAPAQNTRKNDYETLVTGGYTW